MRGSDTGFHNWLESYQIEHHCGQAVINSALPAKMNYGELCCD